MNFIVVLELLRKLYTVLAAALGPTIGSMGLVFLRERVVREIASYTAIKLRNRALERAKQATDQNEAEALAKEASIYDMAAKAFAPPPLTKAGG